MLLLRRAAPIVVLVLLIAACSAPAATSSGNPPVTSASVGPAATGAAPTAAAPTAAAALSLADLGGTWTFVPSNPRVLAATGDQVGGTVVINGDRYKFSYGSGLNVGSSEGPIDFEGTKDVTCKTSSCSFEGVPIHQLFLVDGELAILNAGTLTPLGTFGDGCPGWQDLPGGGTVTVVSTGLVSGQEVPTVVQFIDGDAGGVGTACEGGSHVVAWDVTATRQP
ncbi:MAG: hypothetical protein ABIZ52_03500 [Candidatus Limnocylindrales bacterium]